MSLLDLVQSDLTPPILQPNIAQDAIWLHLAQWAATQWASGRTPSFKFAELDSLGRRKKLRTNKIEEEYFMGLKMTRQLFVFGAVVKVTAMYLGC